MPSCRLLFLKTLEMRGTGIGASFPSVFRTGLAATANCLSRCFGILPTLQILAGPLTVGHSAPCNGYLLPTLCPQKPGPHLPGSYGVFVGSTEKYLSPLQGTFRQARKFQHIQCPLGKLNSSASTTAGLSKSFHS